MAGTRGTAQKGQVQPEIPETLTLAIQEGARDSLRIPAAMQATTPPATVQPATKEVEVMAIIQEMAGTVVTKVLINRVA